MTSQVLPDFRLMYAVYATYINNSEILLRTSVRVENYKTVKMVKNFVVFCLFAFCKNKVSS